MNQKTKKQAMYWLKVAVVGIALGLGLQFVRAWTEPTTAPPGGNVGAPINTGAQVQSKAGGLDIGGKLKVGTDTQVDAAGQIKFDGSDYWGFVPGVGWKSFTATGGSPGTTPASCTIGRVEEPDCLWWPVGLYRNLRLINAPFPYNYGGDTQAKDVYFSAGASEGTFPHDSTITIYGVVLGWNDNQSACAGLEGSYNFQCLDGQWKKY